VLIPQKYYLIYALAMKEISKCYDICHSKMCGPEGMINFSQHAEKHHGIPFNNQASLSRNF